MVSAAAPASGTERSIREGSTYIKGSAKSVEEHSVITRALASSIGAEATTTTMIVDASIGTAAAIKNEDDNEETFTSRKTKKTKKRYSKVWDFFETSVDGTKRRCVRCSKSYSDSTSTAVLARHVDHMHSELTGGENLSTYTPKGNKKTPSALESDKCMTSGDAAMGENDEISMVPAPSSRRFRRSDIDSQLNKSISSDGIGGEDDAPINVVAYGDSLTWGADPDIVGGRLRYEDRWTSVVQEELGAAVHMIPEGLSGRTLTSSDALTCHGEYNCNGRESLMTILHSHKPVDILILFLGTNDIKHRFSLLPIDVARAVQTIVRDVENSSVGSEAKKPPKIFVVGPAVVKDTDMARFWGFEEGTQKARATIKHCETLLKKDNPYVTFIDIAKVATVGSDGVHFDASNQRKLGKHMANVLKQFIQSLPSNVLI